MKQLARFINKNIFFQKAGMWFKNEKILITLILFALLSLFPNLHILEFRGEESLRALIAYEMFQEKNFLQPTVLGENYHLKPPLFNWLIVLYSFIFGWNELTGRLVTITFLGLNSLLLYFFSFKILKNRYLSLISVLVFVTFFDVIFWYGYLAEIDITYTFFIFLMMTCLFIGFYEKKNIFLLLAGIIFGLSFLLKGFPSIVFFLGTIFGFILYLRSIRIIFNLYLLAGLLFAFFIPYIWIINTAESINYLNFLLQESLARIGLHSNQHPSTNTDLINRLVNIISFPILNFKQLLPSSLIVLLLLISVYRANQKVEIDPKIKILIVLVLVNYIPFLISKSAGRYVLPLFPLVAIIFAYLIVNIGRDRWIKIFLISATFIVFVRFLLGFIGIPLYMEKKVSRKAIAEDIYQTVSKSKNIAFDCYGEKVFALYLDIKLNKVIKKSHLTNNWDYLIDCTKREKLKLVKEYDLKDTKLFIYER